MPGFMGLFTPEDAEGDTFVLEKEKVLELEASGQLDGITPAVRAMIDAILNAEKHVFTENEVMSFSMAMDKVMAARVQGAAPFTSPPPSSSFDRPVEAPNTGIREGNVNVDARRTLWSPGARLAPPAMAGSAARGPAAAARRSTNLNSLGEELELDFATSSGSLGHYYPPATGFEGGTGGGGAAAP